MSDSTVSNPETSFRTPAEAAGVQPDSVSANGGSSSANGGSSSANGGSSVARGGSSVRSSPTSGIDALRDDSSTQPGQILIDGQNIAPDDPTVISRRPPTPAVVPAGGTTSAELGYMLEGEKLDHFELDKFIGGGGMGAVFRGTDTALGRTVAIKVLLRQFAADEETVRRFQNEAQSAARLDHENIARVYYVGEDRGWHYIVLEYIEGENLRDLVNRQGPLPLASVVSYTLQVAEALAHAGSRDVIHRDIKPSNVLINEHDRAKVVDMGLARLHQVEQSHDDLTASGVTLGTFDYISPEQARDPRSADIRSDLYSLGCTFYFMLTGRPPFPEGTVLQKLLRHQGDEPTDPRTFRPDLPDSMCKIKHKLLAKNPKDRYQDPGELIRELLLASDELGLQPQVTDSAVWMTIKRDESTWLQRHLPWIVPVALLAVIAFLVDYASSSSGGDPPSMPRAAAPTSPSSDADSEAGDPPLTANGDNGGATNGDTTAPAESQGSMAAADDNENGHGDSVAGGASDVGNGETTKAAASSQPNGTTPEEDHVADAQPVPRASGGRRSAGNLDDPPPIPPKINGGESLLFVTGDGDGVTTFDSLADACVHAPSGAVIELRYNGRLERPERPLQVTHRKLTIRAGEDFQPLVRFRPESPDPILYPRSMIQVVGGELTLSNVHLELEIPSHVRAEDWTLFEAMLADKIRMLRCSMTIRNAADDMTAMYKDVSFFKVEAPPRRELPPRAEMSEPQSRLHIELRDCIVRGEATVLRGTALDTVQLTWQNGLLATSERLVDVKAQVSPAPMGNLLEVKLEHVTALARGGFFRTTTREDLRHLIAMRLDFTDCILITSNTPLIEQTGLESDQEFRRHILWNANQNFYEDFEIFWRIDSLQDMAPIELDWTAWHQHWGPGRERIERPTPVMWASPSATTRPVSQHVVADYLLDASDANPARHAATDGKSDAGMNEERLPEVPPAVDKLEATSAGDSDAGAVLRSPASASFDD